MKTVESIDRRAKERIIAAGAVSLLAWLALQALSPRPSVPWSNEMAEAAQLMERAIAAVSRYGESAGVEIDETLDPNRTGLIGPEYSPLFTTLGQLEAKRTTTNPDLAALLVHLLRRAGVSVGDTIALGCSASFPALMIAAQVAAEAIGVHPVTILSLGASAYGATQPEFNLLDIHRLLTDERILATAPAAVSLGGEDDVGAEFEPALKESLLQQIDSSGVPLVYESGLRRNVARRMAIYLGGSEVRASDEARPDPVARGGRGRVAAFINIGGADANLGSSPLVLNVGPGLNTELALPAPETRGVLFEMAARAVPVVHLLNIRGLALRYGLPWDPEPLPEPGTTRLRDDTGERDTRFWLITAAYLAALALIAVAWPGRSD